MSIGTLYGVGIGPGDPRLMTLRAAEILRAVDVIFTVTSPNARYSVSGAAVASLAPLRGEMRELTFSMARSDAVRQQTIQKHADSICAELEQGRDCAFATIGDAMTYSTFGYMLEKVTARLPKVSVEVVPGVNAFSALAARAGQVLVEDEECLRVIPAFDASMADALTFPPCSTTVLLKTYRSRGALLERLRTESNITVTYAERLGLDEEFLCTTLEEIAARPETYLSLMMIKKR